MLGFLSRFSPNNFKDLQNGFGNNIHNPMDMSNVYKSISFEYIHNSKDITIKVKYIFRGALPYTLDGTFNILHDEGCNLFDGLIENETEHEVRRIIMFVLI